MSHISKLETLFHKTHSKVLLVLRYYDLACGQRNKTTKRAGGRGVVGQNLKIGGQAISWGLVTFRQLCTNIDRKRAVSCYPSSVIFQSIFLLPLCGGKNSIFNWLSKLNPPSFIISLTHISLQLSKFYF